MVLLSIYLSRNKGRQKKPQLNSPAQAVVKLLAPIFFSTAFNYLRYINSSRIVESCRIILSNFLFYNCAKWLLKIAENKDVTVNLRHLMDFGKGGFNIKVLNTGKIVNNMDELVYEAGEYC